MSALVVIERCSECPYQTNTKLDAGYLFGCQKKETIVYDTIAGMEFDCHPQCPLQDTKELLEALEEMKYTPLQGKRLDKEGFDLAYNKLYKALGCKDE